MSVRLRSLLMELCFAALALAVWAEGLVVCKACGREIKPGETVCAHCSTAVPAAKLAGDGEAIKPSASEDTRAVLARQAKAAMESSLRQARDLEGQHAAVALGYYQNALSLMRLSEASKLPAGVSDALLAGNARTMRALLHGKNPCRKCNGTGKYQMDLGRVMQKGGGVIAGDGVPCQACNGEGGVPGYRDISKVKMEVLQGRQEFERRQMAEGDVRVGRALVPASLDKLLDNRSRAMVMTGIPVPCGECQLTGRQKCATCKGTGWVKCAYSGCVNGLFEEKRSSSSRVSKRLNEEQTKKCPKCGGLAEVPCVNCKGIGNVACSKCDGSGLAARCSRCTGTGLMTCLKCKGRGELKGGPCPECNGEKVSLCSTCRGEGALAR